MFLKTKSEDSCVLYCKCGCNNGILLKYEKDSDLYSVSLVSEVLSTKERSWNRFKERCKRIWYVLRNKEYSYFDLYVSSEDITELKEFVNKM